MRLNSAGHPQQNRQRRAEIGKDAKYSATEGAISTSHEAMTWMTRAASDFENPVAQELERYVSREERAL